MALLWPAWAIACCFWRCGYLPRPFAVYPAGGCASYRSPSAMTIFCSGNASSADAAWRGCCGIGPALAGLADGRHFPRLQLRCSNTLSSACVVSCVAAITLWQGSHCATVLRLYPHGCDTSPAVLEMMLENDGPIRRRFDHSAEGAECLSGRSTQLFPLMGQPSDDALATGFRTDGPSL